MSKNKKISDEEFLAVLRENAGLYARTARAIRNQFKIPYSRQAVRDRAERFPDELADIHEENTDVAEEGLLSIMEQDLDKRLKLDAIKTFLKAKAKLRGYVERSEITGSNGEQIKVEFIFANNDH